MCSAIPYLNVGQLEALCCIGNKVAAVAERPTSAVTATTTTSAATLAAPTPLTAATTATAAANIDAPMEEEETDVCLKGKAVSVAGEEHSNCSLGVGSSG